MLPQWLARVYAAAVSRNAACCRDCTSHRSRGIVTIGLLGLITSALFQELERKVIPWKQSE
jgi:hypothetical protein